MFAIEKIGTKKKRATQLLGKQSDRPQSVSPHVDARQTLGRKVLSVAA
jgi:hypothetical protein